MLSENVIKVWSDSEPFFWKKPWAIVQGFLLKLLQSPTKKQYKHMYKYTSH